MKKIILNSLFCILCGACALQTKPRGYVFPENLDSKIAEIKTTAQLEDKLGSPLVKTVHGAPVWIYYGAKESHRGPFPMTWDDKVILLVWVNHSQVIKTKILRDGDLPNLEIDEGETEIPAAIELNMMEELFNNVGRFSPAGLGQ